MDKLIIPPAYCSNLREANTQLQAGLRRMRTSSYAAEEQIKKLDKILGDLGELVGDILLQASAD